MVGPGRPFEEEVLREAGLSPEQLMRVPNPAEKFLARAARDDELVYTIDAPGPVRRMALRHSHSPLIERGPYC